MTPDNHDGPSPQPQSPSTPPAKYEVKRPVRLIDLIALVAILGTALLLIVAAHQKVEDTAILLGAVAALYTAWRNS